MRRTKTSSSGGVVHGSRPQLLRLEGGSSTSASLSARAASYFSLWSYSYANGEKKSKPEKWNVSHFELALKENPREFLSSDKSDKIFLHFVPSQGNLSALLAIKIVRRVLIINDSTQVYFLECSMRLCLHFVGETSWVKYSIIVRPFLSKNPPCALSLHSPLHVNRTSNPGWRTANVPARKASHPCRWKPVNVSLLNVWWRCTTRHVTFRIHNEPSTILTQACNVLTGSNPFPASQIYREAPKTKDKKLEIPNVQSENKKWKKKKTEFPNHYPTNNRQSYSLRNQKLSEDLSLGNSLRNLLINRASLEASNSRYRAVKSYRKHRRVHFPSVLVHCRRDSRTVAHNSENLAHLRVIEKQDHYAQSPAKTITLEQHFLRHRNSLFWKL